MAKTDWKFNDIVTEMDMNELGQELNIQTLAIGDISSVPTEAKNAAGAIGELHEELNEMTSESKITIPIKAGAQTIQGSNTPAPAFPKIEGNTLVNLLGDLGSLEDLNKVVFFQSTGVLDSSNKTVGNNGVKATISSGFNLGVVAASKTIPYKAGKYYVLLANAKNGNCDEVYIQTAGITNIKLISTSDNSKFSTVVSKFSPAANAIGSVEVVLKGSAGQYAYTDGLRAYEISASEYAALDAMSESDFSVKYPYLGAGVHGVKGISFNNVQNNLIPPATEWIGNISGTATNSGDITPAGKRYADADYKLIIERTGAGAFYGKYINIPVEPESNYYFHVDVAVSGIAGTIGSGGYYHLTVYNHAGVDISGLISAGPYAIANGNTSMSHTFLTPEGAAYIRLSLNTQDTLTAGKFIFSNFYMVSNDQQKKFLPQKKSTLTLQTELYSSPDSLMKDTFEYINGQPKKIKRLEKKILDGSLAWVYQGWSTGYKLVAINSVGLPAIRTVPQGYVTKFDGKLATNNLGGVLGWQSADYWQLGNSNYDTLFISISNSDSGWGDSYTPTADEIKAFFNGFTMGTNVSGSFVSMYNGTGVKGWRYIIGDTSNGTTIVPSYINPGFAGWKPYEVLYQLFTTAIESVQTGGAIATGRGSNQLVLSNSGAPSPSAELSYAESIYSGISDALVATDSQNKQTAEAIKALESKVDRTINLKAGTNLNAITKTGRYDVNSPVNAPTSSGTVDYYLDVISWSNGSSLTVQTLYSFYTNRMWTRRQTSSGSWSVWEELTGKISNVNSGLAKGLMIDVGNSGGYLQFVSNGPSGDDGAYIQYAPPSTGNITKSLRVTMAGGSIFDSISLYASSTLLADNEAFIGTSRVLHEGNIHQIGKAYVTGTYTGNDATTRDISLPFTPTSVLLLVTTLNGGYSPIYGGLANVGSPVKSTNGTITTVIVGVNKFTVANTSGSTTNSSAQVYNYIAFR